MNIGFFTTFKVVVKISQLIIFNLKSFEIDFYTFFQFTFALPVIWYVIYFGIMPICSSKETLLQKASSLKGTFFGIFTLIILILCLLSAGFGLGDEGNRSLSWNRKNYDVTNDTLMVFTFELKPASPMAMVSHWDDSLDFYDISGTMDRHNLNLEETKEFLERHHCEIIIPTVKASPVYVYGSNLTPKKSYEISYTQKTSPHCSPMYDV